MHPKQKAAARKHRLHRKNRRPDGLLNFSQAAAVLEMTPPQFLSIARDIPHELFGKQIWRFRPQDLLAYRAAHRHQPDTVPQIQEATP